jgi:hypothetical protein
VAEYSDTILHPPSPQPSRRLSDERRSWGPRLDSYLRCYIRIYRRPHSPHSYSGMPAGRREVLGMCTAAASAGAAGPFEGLRAGADGAASGLSRSKPRCIEGRGDFGGVALTRATTRIPLYPHFRCGRCGVYSYSQQQGSERASDGSARVTLEIASGPHGLTC